MCGVVQAMDWNALMEECIVRTLPVDYIYVRPSTLLYELIHKCAVHLGCLRSIVYGSSKDQPASGGALGHLFGCASMARYSDRYDSLRTWHVDQESTVL